LKRGGLAKVAKTESREINQAIDKAAKEGDRRPSGKTAALPTETEIADVGSVFGNHAKFFFFGGLSPSPRRL
jgi:hypothetical protein